MSTAPNLETKVFCVGFNKTGTSTMKQCFLQLGIVPVASPLSVRNSMQLAGAALAGQFAPIAAVARRFRGFEDRPWNVGACPKAMDQLFPGSRFVLTVRNPDSWWRSVHRWVTVHKPRILPVYLAHLGVRELSRDAFVGAYLRYNDGIREYFAGRANLFELDIEAASWSDLCTFLDVTVPEVPFPHANRQDYETAASVE